MTVKQDLSFNTVNVNHESSRSTYYNVNEELRNATTHVRPVLVVVRISEKRDQHGRHRMQKPFWADN